MFILVGKAQKSYDEMFKAINYLEPNLDPSNVSMDFEIAAISSIRFAFPQASINGCFFYLCQSVYRAVVHLGLKADYSDDQAFAHQIRALPALASLNVNDVSETFETLAH